MHKKIITGVVLALAIIFTFTVCFAEDGNTGFVNGVRNVMGGAENAMNNAAQGIGNAAQNAGNAIKNGAGAIGNGIQGAEGDNDDNNANNDNNDNGNYTATRTSADNTMLGMNSTAWTWIILGIAAAGIIAIVWYYSSQITSHNNRDDE